MTYAQISTKALEIGYGVDNVPNRQFPARLNTGLTAVGKRARISTDLKIGHNVIVSPGTQEDQFQTDHAIV